MSAMTIKFKGIEFDVEFDYQPEERMVMYYRDGSGYPGCPASVEITSITHKGTDFFDFLENELDSIEDLILEKLENEDDL